MNKPSDANLTLATRFDLISLQTKFAVRNILQFAESDTSCVSLLSSGCFWCPVLLFSFSKSPLKLLKYM